MKILMVSMRSIHFKRWCTQLEDAGHKVHWFDIDNGGLIKDLEWVNQHTGWRYKGGNFKGRVFLKKYLPFIHNWLENDVEKTFEEILQKVQPDVVHSFVMYRCCVPIFPVMQRNPHIKWCYSSWGSDLYYFRNLPEHRLDLERVLPHIDYMFTDNIRDQAIAAELGFKGNHLGVFPGGGGFKIKEYEDYMTAVEDRTILLIKGYEGRSGRAITVLKAIRDIQNDLGPFEPVVFGADPEVAQFIENDKFLKSKVKIASTKKNMIDHHSMMVLMGQAGIYVGNSNSDGMPNTLLEAIIMGAFPIQSNPGGVTEEVIEHGRNGYLIEDCEDEVMIAQMVALAILNPNLMENAFKINQELKLRFSYETIQKEVLNCYSQIAQQIEH